MDINTALDAYKTAIEEKIAAHWNDYEYNPANMPSIDYTVGNRYARFVKVERGVSSSVHSFVDIKTGDILKAASYRAPAKGVRGSVFDLAAGGFNHYGADYWR